MKKWFILTSLLVLSASASASQSYVGTWCDKYDDFTRVLDIDQNDNVIQVSIGNQAHEAVGLSRGYLSMGASAFQMILNNQDSGAIDLVVQTVSGKKFLKVTYRDGVTDIYESCKVRGLNGVKK